MNPIQFTAPILNIWTDQIQALRKPNDTAWRGLNDAEIDSFSSEGNAEIILQLAQSPTPGAVLKNGPTGRGNFATDELDTAVRYQFWNGPTGYYPFVIEGMYIGPGIRTPVRAYVSALVREYTAGKTALIVVLHPNNLPVYTWA